MKAVKIALCGVLGLAALLAAVRSLDPHDVETWWIYDVKPWIHYGKPVDPPAGDGLQVIPRRPQIDA